MGTDNIAALLASHESESSFPADVTAASVLAAMQAMTNTQAKNARAAIAAQTAVVNVVTDFGAVGDGTTDDAAAIQSALDAGGVVYFPAKTYKIETALKFDSDTILFGEPGATILEGAALDNLMRNKAESTDGGYAATSNVRIIGLTFDGGAYTTDNTLLAFTHADSISIENCTFRNGYGAYHDIEVNSSRNVVIRGCSFNGSRRSGNNAEQIQLDSLTNRFTYPWGNEGAIDSTPCDNVSIEGCVFDVLTKAIGHHNSVAPKNTKFIGNMIIGSGDRAKGIVMPSANTLLVRGNIFSGVIVAVMSATYVCYATITDNIFSGGTNGIVLSGGGNIVAGNTFTGLNRPVAIGAAQSVQTINDSNLITGNRADDCVNGFEGATSNGTSSENIYNGAYSGVFALPPTVVTDAASASVTITSATDNTRYEYGELSDLTVSALPVSGLFEIVFQSGGTATQVTLPLNVLLPDGFSVEANTIYDLSVQIYSVGGTTYGLAAIQGWPVPAAAT